MTSLRPGTDLNSLMKLCSEMQFGFNCLPSLLITSLKMEMSHSRCLLSPRFCKNGAVATVSRQTKWELNPEMDKSGTCKLNLYLRHWNTVVILFHQASHVESGSLKILLSKGWFRALFPWEDLLYKGTSRSSKKWALWRGPWYWGETWIVTHTTWKV